MELHSAPGVVWLDGSVIPESEARVSVLDHGFLYGDSVYEAVRTFGEIPFLLDEHLRRLQRSAEGVGISVPVHLRAAIGSVLRGADGERLLRIILTRGVGPLGYEIVPDQKPTLVVLSRPLPRYPTSYYTDGIAVAVVSVRRNPRRSLDPSLKTSNLLNVRLAYMEARRNGADDAVMLNSRGEVAEASGSNVFIVHDQMLWTPPLDAGILEGITRNVVLTRLAPSVGLAIREGPMSLRSLHQASEIFITSTTRAIMPVTRIDNRSVGDGRPGTLTRRLMSAFESLMAGVRGY